MRLHHLGLTLAVLLVPSVCFASDTLAVSSGVPFVDNVIKVVGALYVLLQAISVFVPKASKFGILLAKIVTDMKGALEPTAEVEAVMHAKQLVKEDIAAIKAAADFRKDFSTHDAWIDNQDSINNRDEK